MTRDEIAAIIKDHCTADDGLDGSSTHIAGVNDAADAILAKLELEQNMGYILLTEISYGKRI